MLIEFLKFFIKQPKYVLRQMQRSRFVFDGQHYDFLVPGKIDAKKCVKSNNPLRDYFESYETGHGIWKWEHYLDIYHQFFKKFIGEELVIAEIGIFSGGSLWMWKKYFGEKVTIRGIDIEPDCAKYKQKNVEIFIGDQSDRFFLRKITGLDKKIDIIIDDGSHIPEHQIIAFEEIFHSMNPGGVYVCEDVHGIHNKFIDYVHGLNKKLCDIQSAEDKSRIPTNNLQQWVKGIHIFPYCIVIEKSDTSISHLFNTRKGTEWQPYSGKSKVLDGSDVILKNKY